MRALFRDQEKRKGDAMSPVSALTITTRFVEAAGIRFALQDVVLFDNAGVGSSGSTRRTVLEACQSLLRGPDTTSETLGKSALAEVVSGPLRDMMLASMLRNVDEPRCRESSPTIEV